MVYDPFCGFGTFLLHSDATTSSQWSSNSQPLSVAIGLKRGVAKAEVPMDIEDRIIKLERAIQEEAKIGRIERISIRVGMLIIALLTLLLIILSKFSDVIHVVSSMGN